MLSLQLLLFVALLLLFVVVVVAAVCCSCCCSVAQKRLGVTIKNDCDPQLLHEQTAAVETNEK